MAQLMNNAGLIVANELFKDRLPALGQNILRLGVTNTIITSYQAQEFPRPHQFDHVMADVPCSGEGNFRIGPKVREHRVWNLERLITHQRRIIIRAYELLRPNGTMLYSTCTYNPFENEAIVAYLLENSDAELIPFDPPIRSEPGLTGWLSKGFHPNLSMARRFYPHHTGSVGFFVAYIRKPGKRADL
ncbi:MAG: RsmB/NOP family class I SAM-dependent RNA methyltransferase, partial [Desulfatiglandales bacterium]